MKENRVVCYHITYQENMSSIRERGLIPAIGELSSNAKESAARVYLFPDKESVSNALLNWGDVWDEDKELILLELSVPEAMLSEGEAGYELYAYKTIPPECIQREIDEMQMADYLSPSREKDMEMEL